MPVAWPRDALSMASIDGNAFGQLCKVAWCRMSCLQSRQLKQAIADVKSLGFTARALEQDELALHKEQLMLTLLCKFKDHLYHHPGSNWPGLSS